MTSLPIADKCCEEHTSFLVPPRGDSFGGKMFATHTDMWYRQSYSHHKVNVGKTKNRNSLNL